MSRGMDMNGKNINGTNTTGKNKKKFPLGWLLPVAALSLFLGLFCSYIPAFHGIVSLFVFSRFLAGLCGTQLLL